MSSNHSLYKRPPTTATTTTKIGRIVLQTLLPEANVHQPLPPKLDQCPPTTIAKIRQIIFLPLPPKVENFEGQIW